MRFPEYSRTVQEEIDEVYRSIGSVGVSHKCQSHHLDYLETSETEIFHMDSILRTSIYSVKVSKVEVTVQDDSTARMFESKERHTTVTPDDLSECCSIGLGQSKGNIKHIMKCIVRLMTMSLARKY